MFLKSLVAGMCCCILTFHLNELSAKESECANKTESHSPIIISTVMNSSVQKVWDVMIDFKNYGRWNRWVGKIDGEAKEGAIVRAHGKTMDAALDLQITSMQAPHTLCWNDVTWFTHLGVGGWRCRTIEALPDGKGVKFTNHFEYSGVFKWVFSLYTREMLVKGMTLENESLRDFVENNVLENYPALF